MARRLYECVVCGRKFPQGQGVVIHKAGVTLYFHSNDCAAKFLRLLLERVDDSCVKGPLKEVLEELGESIKRRRESSRKVI
ncbi:hypothetical protein [Stetteria hydrogenophila]